MYDQELSSIVDAAFSRIHVEMQRTAPNMAQRVHNWMTDLYGTEPEARFKHPLAFPMLLFPWWLERTVHQHPDTAFQADLVYSTVNGYYFIRLIDNLMDGHATVELKLLPALGFFHTQFQAAYQRYFPHGHPFWAVFERVWFRSAEATIVDADLADLSQEQFVRVAANKTCAAKIPVVAVCCRYERQDLIAPWSRFLDLFGRWHQMWNDVFTWRRDIEQGTRTYFLSEADRRKSATQSATEWVMWEGFDWGISLLQEWMDDLRAAASHLKSEDVAGYLDERETMLAEQREQVVAGLQSAVELLELLEQT
jgi:hypothetical protein